MGKTDWKEIAEKEQLAITKWYTKKLIEEDMLNENKDWSLYERGTEVIPGYIIIDEITPFDEQAFNRWCENLKKPCNGV